MSISRSGSIILLWCCGLASGVGQAVAATPLTTERVASGLSLPLYVTAPPGDPERLFIVEQRGSGGVGNRADIRILDLGSGVLNAAPFLSISPVSTGSEQGLLGLAFHPEYAANGFFYVSYTNSGGTSVIARYQVSANPDLADAGSAQTVLTLAQPFTNHNGGWIGFSPRDRYLYISMGDGGSSNDPGGRAQDLNVLLGKLLRVDLNRDDFPGDPGLNYAVPASNPFAGAIPGLDEIWAYGVRNPWRGSFDRVTHDFYIGDVGQGAWEEIDFQPAASAGGENYGWRCMEGLHCTGLSGCTCNAPALTLPIHEFSHGAGNCSVTGGYVYRGCAIPDLRGTYFFADYCSAQIWSFRYYGAVPTGFTIRTVELDPPGAMTIASITSFGEDRRGELYICDQGGEVFRIIPNGPVDPPTPQDYDNDGDVDLFDAAAFVSCQTGPGVAFDNCLCDVFDADGDGDTDLADFAPFQLAFAP
jgi:glucose/arabinose dehydrogenase